MMLYAFAFASAGLLWFTLLSERAIERERESARERDRENQRKKYEGYSAFAFLALSSAASMA